MSVDGRRQPSRWVVAAIAVAVVLAVTLVAVALLGTSSRPNARPAGPDSAAADSQVAGPSASANPSPSASVSPSASSALPRRPPDDRLGPVILVPGFGGDVAMLNELVSALRTAGRTAITVSLPDAATGDRRGQEKVLAERVDAELAHGAPSVDLIGYSAGGIVVALFASSDPSHVRRAVTLASPLHGTRLAGLAAGLLASACPTACQQLVPGSPLLASLESPDITGIPWLSVWTADDDVVTPPNSARFTGARNVELQDVCADDAATHASLPSDPLAIGLILQALSAKLPMPLPSAPDCERLRTLGGLHGATVR